MSTRPEEPPTTDAPASPSPHVWWPYAAPMIAFLALTSAEAYLPTGDDGQVNPTWYALVYTAKMVIVTILVYHGRAAWVDLRPWWPSRRDVALAVGIGLAVTVGWVGLQMVPYPRFGVTETRTGFNPFVLPPLARVAFLAVRFYGLVLLVPVFEELFWRSFVLRMVIDAEFSNVPIGQVTPLAAVVTSVLFATAHPEEWLPAVLTGLAWAWLLWKTNRLSACVLSHAVANLGLGIFVLASGEWQLW